MNTDNLRKYQDEGTHLARLINDMIFENKINQYIIAYQTGKLPSTISCIMSPYHPAQFTVTDLPVLMRLLDGKAILKVISGWLGMVPADIPTAKPNHNHVMGTAGQLLTTVSDAIKDGELTCQEIHQIKGKLSDLIGSVDTLLNNKFGVR